MKLFTNLSIKKKLLFSNILIGILILLLSAVSIKQFSLIHGEVDILENDLLALNYLLQADRDLYQALSAERSLIFLEPKSDEFTAFAESHEENIIQAHERMDKLSEVYEDPEAERLSEEYQKYREEWEVITREIRNRRESDTPSGKTAAIELSFGSGSIAFNNMRSQLDMLTEYIETHSGNSSKKTRESLDNATNIIGILCFMSIVIATFFSIVIPNLILKPVNDMIKKVSELAGEGGDLTHKIIIRSNDEIGTLGKAINSFIDSLRVLVTSVVNIGEDITKQAKALNDSSSVNHDMAENALTASNVLANSITGMATSIHDVAQHANDAEIEAQQASSEGKAGEEIVIETLNAINKLADEVQKAGSAIDKLKTDSGNIEAVVNVIEGIAEQTNLLALNAAIEAARAGEQGRGFAVVADEVRALASRTQDSTEEIQTMTDGLQESAEQAFTIMEKGRKLANDAVERANQAGQSLNNITGTIDSMANKNLSIDSAAKEQSSSAEEIHNNAIKLTEFSKESSELSDKVSEISKDLSKTAEHLQSELRKFRT